MESKKLDEILKEIKKGTEKKTVIVKELTILENEVENHFHKFIKLIRENSEDSNA